VLSAFACAARSLLPSSCLSGVCCVFFFHVNLMFCDPRDQYQRELHELRPTARSTAAQMKARVSALRTERETERQEV
jgi:hypothetical protein